MEFWLPPEERSPLTYKIRDCYHKSPLIVITLGGVVFYLIGRYTSQISIVVVLSLIVAVFIGEVLGHCFWGRKWHEGEQEHPTYLGED